jgi:hypothetical protein
MAYGLGLGYWDCRALRIAVLVPAAAGCELRAAVGRTRSCCSLGWVSSPGRAYLFQHGGGGGEGGRPPHRLKRARK